MASSTADVELSSFTNSYAKVGGAFHISSSILRLKEVSLYNSSAEHAGVISLVSGSELDCVSSTFSDFQSETSGSFLITDSKISASSCTFQHFTGCAVAISDVDSAELVDVTFSNGEASGPCILVQDCKSLVLQRGRFTQLSSSSSPILIASSAASEAVIQATVFSSNSGFSSGCLAVSGVNLTLTDANFTDNHAASSKAEGGALQLSCPQQNCNSSVQNSTFLNNTSTFNGGAIAWHDVKPTLLNLTFSNNSAKYGADISCFASQIKYFASTTRRTSDDYDFYAAPGQVLPFVLTFGLIDAYDAVVTTDNTTNAFVSSLTKGVVLNGVSAKTAVMGMFYFDALEVEAPINSSFIVKADVGSEAVRSLELSAFARECHPGEAQESNNSCIECKPGYYSFTPSQSCAACPNEAICYGNYTMVPKQGAWRESNTTDLFFPCNLPEACLGSPDTALMYTGECAEGYYGNLCNTCLVGYTRLGKMCVPCPKKEYNVLMLVSIGVLTAAAAVFLVWSAIRSALLPKSQLSIYFKVLVNYTQFMSQVVTMHLNWPTFSTDFLRAQEVAGNTSTAMYAFDCLSSSDNSNSLYFRKIVLVTCLPLAILSLSSAYWGVVAKVRHNKEYLKKHLVTTVIVLYFMLHPSITSLSFSLLSCRELMPGEYWLKDELQIQCWKGEHLSYVLWYGIPCIVVWVFAVPISCLLFMRSRLNELESLENKFRFGFLWNGYKKERFYWEFAIIGRKIVTICAIIFIYNISVLVQAMSVLLIAILFLLLQYSAQPFKEPLQNRLEFYSILAVFVTCYAGVLFLSDDLKVELQAVVFAMVILANANFLLRWGYSLSVQSCSSLRTCPCLRCCFKRNYNANTVLGGAMRDQSLALSGIYDNEIGNSRKQFGSVTPMNSFMSSDLHAEVSELHSLTKVQ
jgi:hypothetical protein